jgi:hypothetical protein
MFMIHGRWVTTPDDISDDELAECQRAHRKPLTKAEMFDNMTWAWRENHLPTTYYGQE